MITIDFTKPCSIYFVGIGGVSMSGLAELLKTRGFEVSGSDRAPSEATRHLEAAGITVLYGQRQENITASLDCVVFTSAIKEDNPEYIATMEKNIPFLTRGQLMGQLMKNYGIPIAVSGTHGKTTTTSMISELMLKGSLDPTVFVGGTLKTIGGNLRIGHSDYFITEACEYTNSFLNFFPKIGVILNVEEDHMDFFHDIQEIRESFHRFAQLLPEDGTLIINADIPAYEELLADTCCQVITFSASSKGMLHPESLHYDEEGHPVCSVTLPSGEVISLALSVYGIHNITNALAALATGLCLQLPVASMLSTLKEFHGTDRRFQYKGSIGGVTVIDDYAHHPTEISCTLNAAKEIKQGTLYCVFQPHTYTRTKAFLEDFAKALSLADKVVLANIYAARETDTLGISSKTLQEHILALGHPSCEHFESFDEIENYLLENCINGDMLITMGAGDVHKIGENILGI